MMLVGVVSARSLAANCLTVASNALEPVRMMGFGIMVVSLHITWVVCAWAARASSRAAAPKPHAAKRLGRFMESSELVRCVRQDPYRVANDGVNAEWAPKMKCCDRVESLTLR
jgi:hypothetical protein